jgi:integrase
VEARRVANRRASRYPLPQPQAHLRHAGGNAERQPKIVQDTLGHASLSMTLGIYSHVQAAKKDEAAAAMDSTLFLSRLVYG